MYAKLQNRSATSPRPASSLRNLCSDRYRNTGSLGVPTYRRSYLNPLECAFADKHCVLPGFSRNRPPSSSLEATLTRMPISVHSKGFKVAVNPFRCNIYTKYGGRGLPNRPPLRDSVPLCHSRPIAAQSLWCNNLQRHGISSPSGETTPLPPVSKITRADIGDCWSLVPFARRAWVQRSNAMSVLVLHRSAGWLERI